MTLQAASQPFDWHDPLQVIGFVLSLLVAIAFIVFVWWIGKITKVWWFLGKVRERWQAGQANLAAPGQCEYYGCQEDAMRYSRHCSYHQQLVSVIADEAHRRNR